MHYCECPEIRAQFWSQVLRLMDSMGLATYQDRRSFIAVGRVNDSEAADEAQMGMLVLAWRKLYEEMWASRLDNRPLNLSHAYKRFVGLLRARLIAYCEYWKKHCEKNTRTTRTCCIPVKFRCRTLIDQGVRGQWQLHDELQKEIWFLDV